RRKADEGVEPARLLYLQMVALCRHRARDLLARRGGAASSDCEYPLSVPRRPTRSRQRYNELVAQITPRDSRRSTRKATVPAPELRGAAAWQSSCICISAARRPRALKKARR